jgi:hypothetical protein
MRMLPVARCLLSRTTASEPKSMPVEQMETMDFTKGKNVFQQKGTP